MKNANASTLIALVLMVGCASPNDPRDVSDAEFRERFQTAYVEPYNAKDIDAWLEAFTADAVGMHNGMPPLVGRDAIRSFGESVRDNFALAEIDASLDEIRRSGDWVYTRGTYRSNFVPKNPGQGLPSGEQTGKFLLIWEVQDDGRWRIILDMGNSNGPA